jgi:hypothetical protein
LREALEQCLSVENFYFREHCNSTKDCGFPLNYDENISLRSRSGESILMIAVVPFSGCLSRQEKTVGMRRIGMKSISGGVVQGREKSVLSTTVVLE